MDLRSIVSLVMCHCMGHQYTPDTWTKKPTFLITFTHVFVVYWWYIEWRTKNGTWVLNSCWVVVLVVYIWGCYMYTNWALDLGDEFGCLSQETKSLIWFCQASSSWSHFPRFYHMSNFVFLKVVYFKLKHLVYVFYRSS